MARARIVRVFVTRVPVAGIVVPGIAVILGGRKLIAGAGVAGLRVSRVTGAVPGRLLGCLARVAVLPRGRIVTRVAVLRVAGFLARVSVLLRGVAAAWVAVPVCVAVVPEAVLGPVPWP